MESFDFFLQNINEATPEAGVGAAPMGGGAMGGKGMPGGMGGGPPGLGGGGMGGMGGGPGAGVPPISPTGGGGMGGGGPPGGPNLPPGGPGGNQSQQQPPETKFVKITDVWEALEKALGNMKDNSDKTKSEKKIRNRNSMDSGDLD